MLVAPCDVSNYVAPRARGPSNLRLALAMSSQQQILELYRSRYTPTPGSPLIDAGHGGNGNDIGAVGAGTANINDLFGILTP